ncbi:hypothetical protein STEG23_033973, partial [Scotinomys teguina]
MMQMCEAQKNQCGFLRQPRLLNFWALVVHLILSRWLLFLLTLSSGMLEKETFLDPFVLRDLLPASLGSYYRYTGSLTTPPCSEIVEWIVFRRPVPISYHQLEAFYSIFTTEQQDHVKSVEYLRNNFRPQQPLNDRVVSKSAVRDAWNHDLADFLDNPLGTEASK